MKSDGFINYAATDSLETDRYIDQTTVSADLQRRTDAETGLNRKFGTAPPTPPSLPPSCRLSNLLYLAPITTAGRHKNPPAVLYNAPAISSPAA